MLRAATGLEFLILLFITQRRYRCRDCKTSFRAPDRRLTPRAEMDFQAAGLPVVSGRFES